jgi:hypothetical protein
MGNVNVQTNTLCHDKLLDVVTTLARMELFSTQQVRGFIMISIKVQIGSCLWARTSRGQEHHVGKKSLGYEATISKGGSHTLLYGKVHIFVFHLLSTI